MVHSTAPVAAGDIYITRNGFVRVPPDPLPSLTRPHTRVPPQFLHPQWGYPALPANTSYPTHLPRPGGRVPFVEYCSGLKIHHYLEWRHRVTFPLQQGLIWDIIHPPVYVARAMTDRGVLVKPNFKTAAFQESRANRFELWSDQTTLACYMRKWGPVITSKANPTIANVLNDIYEYLRTPLSRNDIQLICLAPGNAVLLEQARHERAKDGFDLYDVTVQGVFLRSDILGGHRRFQGIRAVQLADGTVRLYFNLGPGPVPRL